MGTNTTQDVYLLNYETGDIIPLEQVREVEIETYEVDPFACCQYAPIKEIQPVTFTCRLDPSCGFGRMIMRILGLSNNYLRMHGGKPLRRIPKKFLL